MFIDTGFIVILLIIIFLTVFIKQIVKLNKEGDELSKKLKYELKRRRKKL